jgi:hypothetical protein
MDINDNLKDYVPYEQMSDYEKRQVDMLVEQYKNGSLNTDYSGISHNDVDRFINTRLNLEEMHRINDKIIEGEKSKNFEANEMRYQLFEDRWKKGFYGNDRREIPGKDESSEVKQLKDEVRSLKGDINELKELLKQKLT